MPSSREQDGKDVPDGGQALPELGSARRLFAGWISKLSIKGRFGRNWKRRYMVLFSNTVNAAPYMAYFTSDACKDSDLRGTIPISDDTMVCEAIIKGHAPPNGDTFCFTVSFREEPTSPVISLICACSDATVRLEWMAAIGAAADGASAEDSAFFDDEDSEVLSSEKPAPADVQPQAPPRSWNRVASKIRHSQLGHGLGLENGINDVTITVDSPGASAAAAARMGISKGLRGANPAGMVRQAVSGNKKRYVDVNNGFDLDLSYIDDAKRVIAMGIPASGVEAKYRNDISEVQRFFKERHTGPGGERFVRIINLCGEEERWYDPALFGGDDHVKNLGFFDHNPCPFEMLGMICKYIDEWLSADKRHVVAVHCKAGKGRTGMVIATYLVHSGECATAEQALQKFGERRTHDGKGVTIPSQKRWVHNYTIMRMGKKSAETLRLPKMMLQKVVLETVPHFDDDGGCDPWFSVEVPHVEGPQLSETLPRYMIERTTRMQTIFDWKERGLQIRHYTPKTTQTITLEPDQAIGLNGTFKMSFFDRDKSADEPMFDCWLHTGFIVDELTREMNKGTMTHEVHLNKVHLDKANKDKKDVKFDEGFHAKLFFTSEPYDDPSKPPSIKGVRKSETSFRTEGQV